MEKSQSFQIERLLNTLVLARKHIQLYPPNSPMVAEVLGNLVATLNLAFGVDPRIPTQEFHLSVTQEGFKLSAPSAGPRTVWSA